VWDSVRRNLIG